MDAERLRAVEDQVKRQAMMNAVRQGMERIGSRRPARKKGGLLQGGLEKIQRGTTTLDEVIRVSGGKAQG